MPILLDTCTAIWIAHGDGIDPEAQEALEASLDVDGRAYVSSITAWEIGLLSARGKIALRMAPQAWFRALLQVPGLMLADMSPEILIASSHLPGQLHKDPADRIIIATAREQGLAVMTRDKLIIDYGKAGYVDVIAC
jgi:PIN domain nuclease of toxin-antitoxin system